jgi:hypothetical protein
VVVFSRGDPNKPKRSECLSLQEDLLDSDYDSSREVLNFYEGNIIADPKPTGPYFVVPSS